MNRDIVRSFDQTTFTEKIRVQVLKSGTKRPTNISKYSGQKLKPKQLPGPMVSDNDYRNN